VLRQAARRLALIFLGILGVTLLVSALVGAAAGASIQRSVAVGFYVTGALLLLGCFVVGARGPLRGMSGEGETVPLFGARRVRRATSDERNEASRTAILLFAVGLVLIVLGSAVDPAHTTF
jgi:hypothetical protein